MRFRARKPIRVGPYFRHFSATIDRDGARGRMASHGFTFPLGPLGRITYNISHRRWTWDNPGPGSLSGTRRKRR